MTEGEHVPVAVPTAWSNSSDSRAQNTTEGRSGAATTTAVGRRFSSRIGRRGLALVRSSLSARDLSILELVDAHRYLTTRQVEAFLFADHATPLTGARVARRVLRRLSVLGVLATLERRIGGVRAGSAGFVWRVGPVGDRLLREVLDVDGSSRARRRQREPSGRFLDHCLAVADTRLQLITASRGRALELLEVQTEPDCWRPYSGAGGGRMMLQPDLYAVTADPRDPDYVDRWFIEVDLGTESLPRLLRKCAAYEAYAATGSQQQGGATFPLVVWLMPGRDRAERLSAAIQRSPRTVSERYRVVTPNSLVSLIGGDSS